jgi:hypothetical protein
VRYPLRVNLPAGGGCGQYFLRTPPPIGSLVRLWSKKVAAPLGFTQASETDRKSEGSLLESKLFPWIFTARSTLNQVLLSASTSLSCRRRGGSCCVLKITFKKTSQEVELSKGIEHLQKLKLCVILQSNMRYFF